MKIDIYTDGSCDPNPGVGGWAAILKANGHTREISGKIPQATNNTAELTAVIEALNALRGGPHDVTIWTDSRYTQLAIEGMRKPKVNINLIYRIKELCQFHRVKVEWVRGHDGQVHNERADYLANTARLAVEKSELA